MTLAKDFPELAAEVISAAADELDDEATAKARQLPIATQIGPHGDLDACLWKTLVAWETFWPRCGRARKRAVSVGDQS
jgi:hypothetical protein